MKLESKKQSIQPREENEVESGHNMNEQLKFSTEKIIEEIRLTKDSISQNKKSDYFTKNDEEKKLLVLEGILKELKIDRTGIDTDDKIDKFLKENNNDIFNKVFEGVDYKDYLEEVVTWMEQNNKASSEGKSSVKLSTTKEDYSYYHPATRGIFIKNSIKQNQLNRLISMSEDGVDSFDASFSHELMHHFQRNKTGNFLTLFTGILKDQYFTDKKIFKEIHSFLHESLWGDDLYTSENIVNGLIRGYKFPQKDEDQFIIIVNQIKNLYALECSDRRIAHLVSQSKDIHDSKIFEEEVKKLMSEKNIDNDLLKVLVELMDAQKILVSFRTKDLSQKQLLKFYKLSK